MTRHGKNSTASTVYSYHEKKHDTKTSGYGTKEARLSKDSIKEFDCCCLTLQPCRNPVVTKGGYLYDKEAILQYIVSKKQAIAKQQKQFEKQNHKRKLDDVKDTEESQSKKLKTFISSNQFSTKKSDGDGASISNMAAGKNKVLPSFWVPSLTPQAKETEIRKPDDKVRCPMTGNPIKMKDLIDVKFTLAKGEENKSLISRSVRYVCAVTGDALGNSVPCAVLKTSGHVVTMDCIEKIIKKDMINPLTGEKLKDTDIIQLHRGGTGFAASGTELKAKKEGAAMPHA